MANETKPWGYRRGGEDPVQIVYIADAATSGVTAGDFLVKESAGGYYIPAAAGELPDCIALDSCSAPASDGAKSVRVSRNLSAVYEYPPDTGTVTRLLIGTTMDVGGAQSVNIDASADDILYCVDVDVQRNTVFVQLIPTRLGVA
jgi:hypothetical protein